MGRSQSDLSNSKSCYEMRKQYLREKRKLRYILFGEMSTLLPSGAAPGSVPRVDKLQSLEAKMASIEVSLGWRRRREALLETLPRAARDLVRELDSLHQTVREKENCIQGLRTQITNLGGTVIGISDGSGGVVSESEKKTIQERLDRVETEIESKKVAVKNLRLTLDKIDITDNIDVRIRAAELEYELEREELNILNLKEESSVLNTRLQESCLSTSISGGTINGQHKARVSLNELLSSTGNASVLTGASLMAAKVSHTPGNPPFHVTFRPPFGCVIDWATDDTRLKKGDRIVEINGDVVMGKDIDDVTKLMSASTLLSFVVARPIDGVAGNRKLEKQLEDRVKENKDLVAKLDKALKERDDLKNDNTRLNHRISYLEDQVSELQVTLQKAKDTAITTGSPNEVLTPSQPGATIIQVFQKGHQTLAVASPELEKSEDRVHEYPTLPRFKSPSCSSLDSGSMTRVDEKEECQTQVNDFCLEEGETRQLQTQSSYSPTETNVSQRFVTEKTFHPGDNRNIYGPYQNSKFKHSSDDSSGDHPVNINGKVNLENSSHNNSNNHSDYDSIEKLRDIITKKSPSYSYKTPSDYSSDSYDKYEYRRDEEHQRLNKITRDYEYYNSDSTYGHSLTISRRIGSENDHRPVLNGRHILSRPSSREDFIGSPTMHNGDRRPSRAVTAYERPPRRVLSPGAEFRGEDVKSLRPRPVPPKKPERLSLQRTTSMQSVEDSRSCSRASSASNPSKSHSNIYNISCYDNLHTDENYRYFPNEDRASRYRDENARRLNGNANSILEEIVPTPSPRNLTHVNRRNSQNFKESRRLTISSTDAAPIYESLLAKSPTNKTKDHHSFPSSRSSPDASAHLDTTLGLEFHQDVRAQPLYEYIPRLDSSGVTQRNKTPISHKNCDREGFQAPPTPSTPPRGIHLSMANSRKKGEEWC